MRFTKDRYIERTYIDDRAIQIAQYIVNTKCTIRSAGKQFHVCKSTVHNDVINRVRYLDYGLYEKAKEVIDYNKKVRHLRGGIATKNKFKKERVVNEGR